MSENWQNENLAYQGDITYLLNDEESEAGVFNCNSEITNILIPRSITHGSKKYNVTSILKKAFKNSPIKSIQFSFFSNIQTIESKAFCYSSIESITIPSQVIHLT